MQTLYQTESTVQILTRIESLRPDTKGHWGKMNVAQMMAHCSAAMEVASGQKSIPRIFIGRILGPLFKSTYVNDRPFSKNSPTADDFVITDQRDFDKEKARLIGLVKHFAEGGEAKCTTEPHSFFGPLTPKEWGTGMYKHLDHHLRQFGA
jgi:uncharacterized protein DUF1569